MTSSINQSTPLMTFPRHVRIWAHPGMTCAIETLDDDLLAQNKVHAIIDKMSPLKLLDQNSLKKAPAQVLKESMYYTEENLAIPFFQDQLCYHQALDYVETHYMIKRWQKLTPNDFQEMLKKIHSFVMGSLRPEKLPGKYRQSAMFISLADETHQKDNLLEYVQKHDSASLPHLKKALEATIKYKDFATIKSKKLVSKKEIQAFEKYFKACPSADLINGLMENLCLQIQIKLKENDCISAACYAHQELTRIHPFVEANGRMARILMNMILMQGGRQPITFVFNSHYTKAIRADENAQPGAFQKYIQSVLAQFEYEAAPVNVLASIRICDVMNATKPRILQILKISKNVLEVLMKHKSTQVKASFDTSISDLIAEYL